MLLTKRILNHIFFLCLLFVERSGEFLITDMIYMILVTRAILGNVMMDIFLCYPIIMSTKKLANGKQRYTHLDTHATYTLSQSQNWSNWIDRCTSSRSSTESKYIQPRTTTWFEIPTLYPFTEAKEPIKIIQQIVYLGSSKMHMLLLLCYKDTPKIRLQKSKIACKKTLWITQTT